MVTEKWETDIKRLVILSGSYPQIRCGVAGHVQLIAQRTAALGRFDIHVLTAADEAVDPLLAKGYTVHPIIKSFSPIAAGNICRQVLKLDPDIVHIQNPTVKYTGWRSVVMSQVAKKLKKKKPHVRLVVMQHDIAVGRPVLRRRYRPLLICSDAITVSNDRDRQAIVDLKIDPAKIHMAPVTSHMPVHPIDADTKRKCRKKFNIPENALCLATFGFIHPGRHIEPIIRAIHLLREKNQWVYTIMMGGAAQGAEDYFQTCQNLCDQLGLTAQIIWTGYATNAQIADGLAAADVFVSMPDRGADMRNTSIHSAMLAGLAIVTRRNRSYYVDKQIEQMGCFMVDGMILELITDKIREAAENPPSLEFRQHLAAWLDPERIWQQHIETNCRAYEGKPPEPLPAFNAD